MFKEPRFETEQHEGLGSLEVFIQELSNQYRHEGIPISDDGRIDMERYRNLHPDVSKDLERNREWEQKWQSEGQIADRRETDGEKLEILAHAIFAKNLGEQFIVVRSSPHDDRINKVDTVLLDRETGNLVCAFDEVGDTTGATYEKKQGAVQAHNLKGGASLKYGIGIAEKDGRREIIRTSASNVPLFYIALPKDRIEKGIKEFTPEFGKRSDFEEKLFAYFVATLSAQVEGLELYSGRLNPDLKTKLAAFKKVLADLNSKREKKK